MRRAIGLRREPPSDDPGRRASADETEEGPDGPQLMIDHRQTASLAAVLNAAARGQLPGLDEALTRGDGAATPVERVARPHPGDEFPAERQRWRELTGEDPGEDVYAVPLEPRTRRSHDRASSGAPGRLEGAAGDPRARGHGEESCGPSWLARRPGGARSGDGAELEVADGSEQRARAAVKRRLFLAELDTIPAALDEAAYPLLAAYRRAAKARRRFARCEERARSNPGSRVGVGPAVSLDWFRLRQKTPHGWTPAGWLAHAEVTLLAADLPPEQAEASSPSGTVADGRASPGAGKTEPGRSSFAQCRANPASRRGPDPVARTPTWRIPIQLSRRSAPPL